MPHHHSPKIPWHTAFFQAIQLELADYREPPAFKYEYQLTAEPLRIDTLNIKKPADIQIDKNMARIFRAENLCEYKSPGDYLFSSSNWLPGAGKLWRKALTRALPFSGRPRILVQESPAGPRSRTGRVGPGGDLTMGDGIAEYPGAAGAAAAGKRVPARGPERGPYAIIPLGETTETGVPKGFSPRVR